MTITLIAALSVDGFIAQNPDQTSTDWTSDEDKVWFKQKTKEIGLVVMGRKTYETFKRPLPDRILIILSESAPAELDRSQLVRGGVVMTSLAPVELVAELEKLGFNQLAVCGGSSIYTQFIQAGLVNTYLLTTEPILFGQGIKLLNEPMSLKLKLVTVHQLSEQTRVGEWEKA